MTNFETLRQEIQSWYPDYQFTDVELNEATQDLIKFFAEGALEIYRQKKAENKNKGLQNEKNTIESNRKQEDKDESSKSND